MWTFTLLDKVVNGTWGGLFRSICITIPFGSSKPHEKCGLAEFQGMWENMLRFAGVQLAAIATIPARIIRVAILIFFPPSEKDTCQFIRVRQELKRFTIKV